MADYYHTARAAKKQIENTQKQNKRNRERLAELRGVDPSAEQIEHPLNLLSIDGRSAKIYRTSPEQHSATERMEGLIPWNGDPDNLIDRFDCRCMLDFYREPPSCLTNEHKPAGDPKLLQLVQFESFRDLVKYASKGYTDEMGIEAALEESIAVRAQARVEANAAFRIQSHQALPGDETTAGQGPYSAVGFNYGNTAAESDSSSSSSDSDDSDGDQHANEEEDEQDALDETAEEYGITNFSWRLHRALQQEGEEEANRRMPRKRSNRKRMRMRIRRMAGNGMDIHGNPLNSSFWRDPLLTGAPSAHLLRPRRPSPPRSSSRSLSPPRRARDPLASIRDLPTAPTQTIDRKAFEKDDNIIDALPDMPDPAMSGPQAFPAASALQNIRVQQESQRRDRRRSRSPVRDRDRERGYYRRRSRSRSRDRYSRRSRSSRSRSRERERDRDRRYSSRRRSSSSRSSSRSRSRSRSPRGDREDRTSQRPKPAVPAQPSKGAPETPAERMKRITQAQLNKQRATDSMKGNLNKKR